LANSEAVSKNPILPEFQDFFVSRSLFPEKSVSFYANWVSKFLAFCNRNEDLMPDLKVEKFLSDLKSQKNIADWQIKQACDNDLHPCDTEETF